MNPAILKVLEWCKNNWVIFIIVGLAGFFLYQRHLQNQVIQDMAKQAQDQFAHHTADLQQMQVAFNNEHTAQEAINQQYNTTLQQLQTTYEQRLSDLEHQTTQRRQAFVTQTTGHPTEMADRLRHVLGWTGSGSSP